MDNGKVLITRRAPKENFAGGWEFPGEKSRLMKLRESVL